MHLNSNFLFCLIVQWLCKWFELQYSVITTTQRDNVYQTVMKKVWINKPSLVRSLSPPPSLFLLLILSPPLSPHSCSFSLSLFLSLSNQISWHTNRTTPFQFQNSLSETTYINTRNINITISRLVSICMAPHCDDSVDTKRVNFLCTKTSFLERVQQPKTSPTKTQK